MIRKPRTLLVVFGLAALVGAALLAAGSNIPYANPSTTTMEPHALVAAPGWVEPASEERELAAEVRGRLKHIYVDEGDPVRAGEVVAEIDDADYSARVQQAKALVHQRAAELEKLLKGARDQERRQVHAELRGAEVALTQARNDLARRLPLVERGFISQETREKTETNLRAAEAQTQALFERAALLDAPPRAEDVAIARALLDNARGQLAEAEAWLTRTRIVSPIDGTVLHRARKQGESVTDDPPTVVVKVGDLSRLRVRIDVDETDIAHVRASMRAYVTTDAFPDTKFHGTVVQVGWRMGRKTSYTQAPTERLDTKVLETLIKLDAGVTLPVGLRVDAFILSSTQAGS